jgi:hypothetical protein
MADLIGADGSNFNTAMPSLVDVANIQSALRYFLYGIGDGGSPANAASPNAVSLFSHLSKLTTDISGLSSAKANIAAPTFTGTVTIPTLTISEGLTNALPVGQGGTGSRNAADARIALGGLVFSSTSSQGTASSARVFVQSSQPTTAAAGDLWLW